MGKLRYEEPTLELCGKLGEITTGRAILISAVRTT